MALFVLTIIFSETVFSISTEEVINNSARSIPLTVSKLCLSRFTLRDASKLDTNSLIANYSSKLKLHKSLILRSCDHFSFNAEFSNFLGKFKNFSK